MRRYLQNTSLILCSLFFNLACSTWDLEERCEKTNWFEYSQGLSFQGKYLEEDTFVKECKGVEKTHAEQLDRGFKLGREKMCQYSEIFNRGKDGTPVFFKFCDGLDLTKMHQKYNEGLLLYCTNDVGYKFGKSGKIYQNVCPQNLETQFLPSYHKGRREFLTDEVERVRKIISSIKEQINSLERQEASANNAYSSIPTYLLDCSEKNIYNEITKKEETKKVCSEPIYIKSQRDKYSSMASSLHDELRKLNSR